MEKNNILNKRGMLSSEDRKESYINSGSFLTFHTNLELSQPIVVIPFGSEKRITAQNYSRDVASFISHWNHFVKPDLNGFQGFHSVEFDTSNIEII